MPLSLTLKFAGQIKNLNTRSDDERSIIRVCTINAIGARTFEYDTLRNEDADHLKIAGRQWTVQQGVHPHTHTHRSLVIYVRTFFFI